MLNLNGEFHAIYVTSDQTAGYVLSGDTSGKICEQLGGLCKKNRIGQEKLCLDWKRLQDQTKDPFGLRALGLQMFLAMSVFDPDIEELLPLFNSETKFAGQVAMLCTQIHLYLSREVTPNGFNGLVAGNGEYMIAARGERELVSRDTWEQPINNEKYSQSPIIAAIPVKLFKLHLGFQHVKSKRDQIDKLQKIIQVLEEELAKQTIGQTQSTDPDCCDEFNQCRERVTALEESLADATKRLAEATKQKVQQGKEHAELIESNKMLQQKLLATSKVAESTIQRTLIHTKGVAEVVHDVWDDGVMPQTTDFSDLALAEKEKEMLRRLPSKKVELGLMVNKVQVQSK